MYARIRIPFVTRTALLVPDVAVSNDQQGSYVLIAAGQNIVQRRNVKVGSMNDDLRVIEEGLSGEEWVIVDGLLRAIPGHQVTPERRDANSPNTRKGS